MAYLNVKERVIEAKVVYYGAGLSGKTTNLERIKGQSVEGHCGDMMSLETDGDRTLFFDWLPYNLGKFNGCDVKMQLYTVPGQAKYAETRKKVLAGADGVVLVLDSEAAALEKNRQCVKDLRDHLKANGLPANIPMVVQLNKRDLPTAMAIEELLRETGLDGQAHVAASAAKGEGVFETLREVTRLVLLGVRDAARSGSPRLESGEKSGLDGETLYSQVKPREANGGRGATTATTTPATATPATATAAPPTSAARAATMPTVKRVDEPPPPSAPKGEAPSGTQLGEVVAGHRALVRRLDQIEKTLSEAITRAVADAERRILGRVEGVATTARVMEGTSAEVREALTTLEARLQSDTTQRTEEVRKAVDASVNETGKRVDSATKQLPKLVEASMKQDAKLEAALTSLGALPAALAGSVAEQLRSHSEERDRTNARVQQVEERLREITDMFAEMMAADKKTKSWWR